MLERLKPLLNFSPNARYPLDISDDAAVRNGAKGERLILTADTLTQDVHFSLDLMSLEQIGYKTMVANLSDCAAMGALPDGALVQIIFPRGATSISGDLQSLYRGFRRACRRWDFPIVGGNLSQGPCWAIAITLIGRLPAKARPLLRTGIRDNDELWMSGVPGRSAAGLAALRQWGRAGVPQPFLSLVGKHVKPEPRVKLGLALARTAAVHAAMDLSDGLSKDCATLCYENRLGLILELDAAHVPPDMIELSQVLGVDPLEWVLHGGEDYELLFAASPRFVERSGMAPLRRIGRFSSTVSGVWVGTGSTLRRVPRRGYDHLSWNLPRSSIGF